MINCYWPTITLDETSFKELVDTYQPLKDSNFFLKKDMINSALTTSISASFLSIMEVGFSDRKQIKLYEKAFPSFPALHLLKGDMHLEECSAAVKWIGATFINGPSQYRERLSDIAWAYLSDWITLCIGHDLGWGEQMLWYLFLFACLLSLFLSISFQAKDLIGFIRPKQSSENKSKVTSGGTWDMFLGIRA